jgi:hypothetical protein
VTVEELEAIRRLASQNLQPIASFIRDAVNEAAADCGARAVFLSLDRPRSGSSR